MVADRLLHSALIALMALPSVDFVRRHRAHEVAIANDHDVGNSPASLASKDASLA